MPKVKTKKDDPLIGRTYQIPSSEVTNFDKVIASLSQYARNNNLPAVDRSEVVTKLMKTLKPFEKKPELYFQ